MKKKFLAAALASVMAVTSAMAVSAVELGDISGDLTVTGYFTEKTDAVELKSGESYTIEFKNQSNGTEAWDNFILAIAGEIGDKYIDNAQEVLIIRADNWGWGGGYSDFVVPNAAEGNKLVFNSVGDWDKLLADTKAGCDVKISISREGDTLIYNAMIGEYNEKLTATSGKELPESIYVFLTGEKCTLTGITATKTPAETEPDVTEPESTEPEATEPEATEPEATEPEATEPEQTEEPAEPISLGDLTVSTFFNEKTNTVPFKSGDTYTFTFSAKSNGTNNWDNFVLAIGDVSDTANYPENGAEHEALVIRADNWGWGGGLSDFVDPNTDGNKLAFETNIDWDKWADFAKAGFDVTIKLTRNGNTITYNATMGDYYVKLTATSGKALPDDLYVFLTGENCELTGITATPEAKTTPKPNPDTGVAAPYAVAALAIVSAAAVTVLKKKSK